MEQNKNYIEVTARFNLDCIKSLLSHFDIKTSNEPPKPTETQHGAAVALTEAKSEQGDKRTRTRWTEEMERYICENHFAAGGKMVNNEELARGLNREYGANVTASAVASRLRQIELQQTRIVWNGRRKYYYPQQHPINAE